MSAAKPMNREELAGLLEEAQAALHTMADLMSESSGVAGFHLNGDVAEWDEFDLLRVFDGNLEYRLHAAAASVRAEGVGGADTTPLDVWACPVHRSAWHSAGECPVWVNPTGKPHAGKLCGRRLEPLVFAQDTGLPAKPEAGPSRWALMELMAVVTDTLRCPALYCSDVSGILQRCVCCGAWKGNVDTDAKECHIGKLRDALARCTREAERSAEGRAGGGPSRG